MTTTTATTEVFGIAHRTVRTEKAGSGNFHPMTNKAIKLGRKRGDYFKHRDVSRTLWAMQKSGILARLGMEAEGWSRSEDPTAWDALLNIMKAHGN